MTDSDKTPQNTIMSEALSAWMDGEALPEGVAQETVLQWLLNNEHAQQQWAHWHASADALQSKNEAEGATTAGHSAVGTAAWHAQLQQRLAESSFDATENATNRRTSHQAPVDAKPQTAAPANPAAANDAFWGYKRVVGFASVLVAVFTGWILWNQVPTAGTAAPQGVLTAQNQEVTGTATRETTGTVITANAANSATTEDETDDVSLSADEYAESLMLAHTQLGDLFDFDDSGDSPYESVEVLGSAYNSDNLL